MLTSLQSIPHLELLIAVGIVAIHIAMPLFATNKTTQPRLTFIHVVPTIPIVRIVIVAIVVITVETVVAVMVAIVVVVIVHVITTRFLLISIY